MQEQDVVYGISIQKGKEVDVWVVACRVGVWISGLGWGGVFRRSRCALVLGCEVVRNALGQ